MMAIDNHYYSFPKRIYGLLAYTARMSTTEFRFNFIMA